MASDVDICNLALARLGDKAAVSSINPPEGTAQAEHCARFYPIARDSVLEYPQSGWRFATTRATLAQHSLDPIGGWAFAYSYPANCLKPLMLLAPGDVDLFETSSRYRGAEPLRPRHQEYAVEVDSLTGDRVLYTNLAAATLKYTMRANDASKYPPLMVDGLSMWLASYLAGPIIKGVQSMKVAEGWMSKAIGMINKAAASDANSDDNNPYAHHVPDHIRARQR